MKATSMDRFPVRWLLTAAGVGVLNLVSMAAEVVTDGAGDTEGTTSVIIKYWTDCQIFQYPLGFVFVFGLLAAFYKYLLNLRQAAVEQELLDKVQASSGHLAELVERARTLRDNLFAVMIVTIAKAVDHNQPERVDDLVSSYRSQEEERMRNFSRWMTYLSGACGALGLMGTVHGLTSTFNGANWDKSTALKGMGVALATTFVGLVFSLVLDAAAASVNMAREKRAQRNLSRAADLKILVYDALGTRE
ncbi:MAG: MotA/TolQ/ExbB proton channel family protein [Calditrichaeota bacterium]|nr:MotA/TolQ/ExbB proton channel family protein [Candidatus Cloacimonadota bacterium]MCB1046345.1 MotA/TolQ/ExbB proton channel family protein [Calditrichota bacterium]MCB9473388.1 MotA/TolQ/ExbB proton channel family protein [Candidatus Delongbacteria bacterium]